MNKGEDRPPLSWLFANRMRRAAAFNYWIRDTLTGVVGLTSQAMLRFLPIDVASTLGALFGPLIGRVTGSFLIPDASTRDTWMRLRPETSSASQADAAIARARRQVGRVMAEYSALPYLCTAGRIAVSGAEHIRAAFDADRPIIIAGLHLGNWEVIGPALVGLGYRVSCFYEPPLNRFDHAFVVAARRRWGAAVIYPDIAGTRRALRILRARDGVLLMYIDEIFHGLVNAPAFGRNRAIDGNIARVARLAAMTDAVVIPAYIERLDGARFRLLVRPPVTLTRSMNRDHDLTVNAGRLDETIEPIIRGQLEQWYFLSQFKFD